MTVLALLVMAVLMAGLIAKVAWDVRSYKRATRPSTREIRRALSWAEQREQIRSLPTTVDGPAQRRSL